MNVFVSISVNQWRSF